jgi:hypothetical protein
VIGQSGVCSPVDALKAEAVGLCAAQNSALAEIGYDGACDPGAAMFAKVTCCGEEPPPPTPPPGECSYEVTGDPGQCTPNDVLKDQASQQCAAQNLALADIAYDNACGEEASSLAKVVCCPGGEPPPPPPLPCFGELLGDPATCSDNQELMNKAWYLCDGAGAALTSVSFEESCSPEASHFAKVECCFPPTPPPPPGECFGDFIGDPGVCTDNPLLQAQASSLCESQNSQLADFTTDDACGPGSSHTAKFTCCGINPPPPEPPPVCEGMGVASTECVANEELESQAKQLCAAANGVVDGLVFDGACGPASSHSASFVCCAENPPPPVPGCWNAGIGVSQCADNDTFKQMANTDCSAVGAELAKIGYDNACGPNGSTSAEYTCCSPTQ